MVQDNFESVCGIGFPSQVFLASDIAQNGKGYAVGPVRALMSALLFDGIQSFMNFAGATSAQQKSRYQEAFTWVNNKGNDYIFSFESVCEALGVDPQFLRYGLLNACNSNASEWKKTRRNF